MLLRGSWSMGLILWRSATHLDNYSLPDIEQVDVDVYVGGLRQKASGPERKELRGQTPLIKPYHGRELLLIKGVDGRPTVCICFGINGLAGERMELILGKGDRTLVIRHCVYLWCLRGERLACCEV
jgi:hypothetical protein